MDISTDTQTDAARTEQDEALTLAEVTFEELDVREENTFCLCNYSA